MCGGDVRSMLLLPLVCLSRYLETIDGCIWCMFALKFGVLTAWGCVGIFVV